MPKLRTAILAGVAALLHAGAAFAAAPEARTMAVDLPDGSVAQVVYHGDVAPQVSVAMRPPQPIDPDDWSYEDDDAFDDMILDDYEAWDDRPVWPGYEPVRRQYGPLVIVGERPRGFHYFYTLISTSPRGEPCTRTIEWRSNGFGREPDVRSSGTGPCDWPDLGGYDGPHVGPGPGHDGHGRGHRHRHHHHGEGHAPPPRPY